MSDLPNHHHDPDPAALDELQRAFADDPEPNDTEPDDPDPRERDPSDVDDVRTRQDPEADRATDVVPAVDPGADRATDVVPAVDPEADRATDVVPAVDPEPDDAVPSDRHPSDVGEGDVRTRRDPGVDRATDVVSAVDPAADRDADVAPAPPEIVTLEETGDGRPTPEVDVPRPDDDRPVDLVIVEQEAAEPDDDGGGSRPPIIRIGEDSGSTVADDDGGGSRPPIIRIGDDSGSTAIVDPTPESLADVSPDNNAETGAAPGGGVVAEGADDAPGGGVITISDDDLPDAVYVEGSLDADGSGTIVFIEDDDTGDVLGPESERDLRRGIEPRMRERRVAVKRAQGRRRLKWVGIVAGVVLVVVAVLAVLGSPLFAVREGDVEVFGARYADEERLQEIIDEAVGTPVLRLDTDGVEADIEAISWVDDASVSTDFPHGLVIDIREREAWTTYQGPDGRYRVLDREGRVLDVLDMYPFAYVLIIGPDPVDLEAGDFAPQGYVAASELAKNLTGAMRGRVTEIEVTADGSRLAVHLDDGSTVLFGEARDLLAKLVRLEAVLTNGQEREPGLIDVSTADVTR